MSRYRAYPTPEQEAAMVRHCADARYLWNLAVEQHSHWHRGRKSAPGYLAQCSQLTAARTEYPWLAEGSQTVQQQALRDFAQAMDKFFGGSCGRPTFRKAGRGEGFRITGTQGRQWDVRRLNRKWAEVRIPKVGWVRFRLSRLLPEGVKSFRVTRDRTGRWHVAFAVIPQQVNGPGSGEVVGIDRGVKVSAALSTGEMLTVSGLGEHEAVRLRRLERKLARAKRGSSRRVKAKAKFARMHAMAADRRKDWVEKTSTEIARRFDVIRVERLNIRDMTRSAKGTRGKPGVHVAQKAGLNREVRKSGWGLLVRRLEDKAPGRVEKVPAAYTSQRCSACGHVDGKSRESQADFRCIACGYACNADVNAARNIAAGYAVKARGGDRDAEPMNREPQLAFSA
jgi:putative transposase